MPVADRQFVVPCECSARVLVTAGQAGGRMSCPACGRSVEVPRLRDLAPAAEPAAAVARPAWNVARGLAVAGAAVAIAAAVAAATLLPLGSRLFPQPVSADVIRASAKSAPIGEVLVAWRAMAATGVQRPPMPEELRLQQFVATASRIAGLLWAIAAAGAGVAVAGFVAGMQDRAPARAAPPEQRS